jgi:hypothetical protein
VTEKPASRRRAVIELVLAAVAVVGCGWSWLGARSVVDVSPVADGQPSTASVIYDPPMLLLALLLATLAGVLVVVGVARLRRCAGADRSGRSREPRGVAMGNRAAD